MDYNLVFKWCVETLKDWAHRLNMSYEEINIWIFCIIEPTIFLLMLLVIVRQMYRIQSLKANLVNGRGIGRLQTHADKIPVLVLLTLILVFLSQRLAN